MKNFKFAVFFLIWKLSKISLINFWLRKRIFLMFNLHQSEFSSLMKSMWQFITNIFWILKLLTVKKRWNTRNTFLKWLIFTIMTLFWNICEHFSFYLFQIKKQESDDTLLWKKWFTLIQKWLVQRISWIMSKIMKLLFLWL